MKKISPIENAMNNRQIVILIVVLLVALGCYALVNMPKQEFPSFTIRQGLVVGVYPGATSEQIEEQLTKPLEEFIFQFKEIDKSKTVSQSRNGMVYIVTELNDGVKDKDEFWSKFKLKLQEYKMQLPTGVLALVVKDDFGDTSAILITLESEQKTYRELEGYLDDLESRLRKINSVSNLQRFGLQKEQITVYIDQEKLSSYALNTTTLSLKLFTQGFTTLSGSINNDNYDAPIYISESYNTVKDVEEQIVFSDFQGNVIRLKDIATVVREYPEPTSFITNNGVKSVLLSMQMHEGDNIVHMGHQVNKLLREYEKDLPSDVKIYRITDQSQVVKDSVTNFLKELLIAIISVILIVMVLMPLRVASVAAMTIPITIFISLGIFYMCGIELNTVTFATLLVTLGMIVDNSIVIIDSYLEKIDEGLPRWQASISSTSEFFQSILAATLAISITFFPFMFTTKGILKDFLQTFPWSITIILFVSLLIAVLLIPYLQYFLIRKGLKSTDNSKKKKTSLLDYIQNSYNRLLAFCFKNPIKIVTIGVIVCVIGIIWFFSLPMKILPTADRFQFVVEIFLPNGSSLEKTTSVSNQMEDILRKDERVVSVTAFLGESSPRFHTCYAPQFPGSNYAQFIVNTKNNKATIELLDEYSSKYSNYFPEANVVFRQMEYSDANTPIEVSLSSNSTEELIKYAGIITDSLRKIDALLMVRTDFQEVVPGAKVILNDDEMIRLGINKSAVSINTAMHFGSGLPITTLWEGDYSIPVVMKTEQAIDPLFSDISNELVMGYGGLSSVPLRQFADVQPVWKAGQLVRRNGVPTITIMANVERGHNIMNITKHIKKEINKIDIPDNISLEYGGEDENTNFFLPQIIVGLICAIIIIFFILLFHLKKIVLAFLIVISMVFCIPGSALGIWAMGLDVSMTGILGLVSLMGILVRNGIIMIDYAEELRLSGQSIKEAAFNSAKRRMRPIFLTSAAASMGVVPMILGKSSLWCPMGTVIFFGTWVMMLFVITVLPIAYWKVFERSDRRAKAKAEAEAQRDLIA